MKSNSYRFLYLFLLLALTTTVSYSQTPSGSFNITDNGTATNVNSYVTAIENANFEPFRLSGESVYLSFTNGLTFELYSANALVDMGFSSINPANYRATNGPNYTPPTLVLESNGMIRAAYTSTNVKQ